jgi:hypothetical protein
VGAIVEECLAPCTYFVKKKKKIVDFAEKRTGALWPLQKALFCIVFCIIVDFKNL